MAEQLIYGSIMGDGHITPIKSPNGNASLDINHCKEQADYLCYKTVLLRNAGYKVTAWPYERFSNYWKTTGSGMRMCTERHSFFRQFRLGELNCYANGHDKSVNPLLLERLNEIGLAFWFMDDGSSTENKNGSSAYLHTESFGYAQNEILADYFERRWDIRPRLWQSSKKFWLLFFPKYEFLKLRQLIDPYVIPLFDYKLKCSPMKRYFRHQKILPEYTRTIFPPDHPALSDFSAIKNGEGPSMELLINAEYPTELL